MTTSITLNNVPVKADKEKDIKGELVRDKKLTVDKKSSTYYERMIAVGGPLGAAGTAAKIGMAGGPVVSAVAGVTTLAVITAVQRGTFNNATTVVTDFANKVVGVSTTAATTTATAAVDLAKYTLAEGNKALTKFSDQLTSFSSLWRKPEKTAATPTPAVAQDKKDEKEISAIKAPEPKPAAIHDCNPQTPVESPLPDLNVLQQHILNGAKENLKKIIEQAIRSIDVCLKHLQHDFISKEDINTDAIKGFKETHDKVKLFRQLRKKFEELERKLTSNDKEDEAETAFCYKTASIDNVGHEASKLIEQLRSMVQNFSPDACFLAKQISSAEIQNAPHKEGQNHQTIKLFDGCRAVQFKISQNADEQKNEPPTIYAKYAPETWPAIGKKLAINAKNQTGELTLTAVHKKEKSISGLYFKHHEKGIVKSQYTVDIYVHFTVDLVRLKAEIVLPEKDEVQKVLKKLSEDAANCLAKRTCDILDRKKLSTGAVTNPMDLILGYADLPKPRMA